MSSNDIKAVFLDRDGVLNKLVQNRPPWKENEIELFKESSTLIQLIKQKSYLPVVVTNQPDAARGSLEFNTLYKIHDYICNKLDISISYVCDHPYDGMCNCRKPKIGMLIKAKKEFNLDLKNSFLIGDREKDIVAGKNANCKTICIAQSRCIFADYNVGNHSELIFILKKLL